MDEEGAEADEPTGPAGCRFLQREAEASDGSDDDSADEDASDADSDGNLKGFTVKDDEASESNYETDEELDVRSPCDGSGPPLPPRLSCRGASWPFMSIMRSPTAERLRRPLIGFSPCGGVSNC